MLRTVVTTININTVAAVIEEDWHLKEWVTEGDTESEDNESVTDDE